MEQQEGTARKQKKTMNNGAESYGMLSARREAVVQNGLFFYALFPAVSEAAKICPKTPEKIIEIIFLKHQEDFFISLR